MGTRADFYVGRGESAEWLGSIAWDGYPDGIPTAIVEGLTEEYYREAVTSFLNSRDDATFPEEGWPWPWDNSAGTDYAYAYEDGEVWASCFGGAWFDASSEFYKDDDGPEAELPDMAQLKNVVRSGKRSGLIVFSPSQGLL